MKSTFTLSQAGVRDPFPYLTFVNCTAFFAITFSEVSLTPSTDFCNRYHSLALSTQLNNCLLSLCSKNCDAKG